MDPVKYLGKVREQVSREHITRRKYPQKFAPVADKQPNDNLYNQSFINDKLNQTKAFRPYQYTGEGESYFLSKDMYNSLLGTCRCGRQKINGHSIKCLQKEKNKYLDPNTKSSLIEEFGNSSITKKDSLKLTEKNENVFKDSDEKVQHDLNVSITKDYIKKDISKHYNANDKDSKYFATGKLPETSNGMIGWMRKPYWKWEKSTYYISPKYTMPGYKIDDHPYSNIFIG